MKSAIIFLLMSCYACAGTKDKTQIEINSPQLQQSQMETITGMLRKNKAQGYFIYQNIDSRSLITIRLRGDTQELEQFLEKNVTVEGELKENSPFNKELKVKRITLYD
jgi:aspartokinase